MPQLYDELVRLGIKPRIEFEYNLPTDSLMRVRDTGIHKLVKKRFWVVKRGLHISMIPDSTGVVDTALASLATGVKRPGFWHVVMDASGRPIAEHPLKYTIRQVEPDPEFGKKSDHPPSGSGAVVETTGELTRVLVSWLVGTDRVNDDDIAVILEILSLHAESPRDVTLTLASKSIAQRLHDELLCFEDDVKGLPDFVAQAAKLRAEVSRVLTEFPV